MTIIKKTITKIAKFALTIQNSQKKRIYAKDIPYSYITYNDFSIIIYFS